MHLPKLDLTNFPPQQHTIPFDEAVIRARVWRDSIQKQFGGIDSGGPATDSSGLEGPQSEKRAPVKIDAPKSIYVGYPDLKQLADDYSKVGILISGFRLYFTLEANNADNGYHITGMLVPTAQPLLEPPGKTPINYDLIIPVPIADSDGNTVGMGTSIYDFTVPCPTFCGGTDASLTGANGME